MPTALPRIRITLSEDANDRLQALANVWGISPAGLVRFLAERLAEQVQVVDVPTKGPVFVRGFFPPLLASLTGSFDNAAAQLGLYAMDGAGPARTFHPPDLSRSEIEAEWVRLANAAAEDGATAPPAGAASVQPGPFPPYSNTGEGFRESTYNNKQLAKRRGAKI